MVMQTRNVELQREWFRAKLASEKAKVDAVKKVKEGVGDFVLVDARDRASFEKSHIPGAISMPLDEIDRRVEGLDRNREHVVYCWNAT